MENKMKNMQKLKENCIKNGEKGQIFRKIEEKNMKKIKEKRRLNGQKKMEKWRRKQTKN